METYLVLNGALLAVVIAAAFAWRRYYGLKPLLFAVVTILVLTAVFDNLIIMSNIVAYDPALISGIKLYKAPIEDFAYCIAAVLIMPLLWKVMETK